MEMGLDKACDMVETDPIHEDVRLSGTKTLALPLNRGNDLLMPQNNYLGVTGASRREHQRTSIFWMSFIIAMFDHTANHYRAQLVDREEVKTVDALEISNQVLRSEHNRIPESITEVCKVYPPPRRICRKWR